MTRKQKERPTYVFEEVARYKGYKLIGGVDEVGRGSLSGPVLSVCVILPKEFRSGFIYDSKLTTFKERQKLEQVIKSNMVGFGVGVASVEEVNRLNVYYATKLCIERAVLSCKPAPDFVIVDGKFSKLELISDHIIVPKADSISITVAAASILAKQIRDRYMVKLHDIYPYYSWNTNKGYRSRKHIQGLEENGLTRHHRRFFSDCKRFLV